MVTKEQIERINELAKKQKETVLTEDEKNEQERLRRLYVDSFKENLRAQLKNIKIVSPEDYVKNKSEDESICDYDHDHDCNCGNHNH